MGGKSPNFMIMKFGALSFELAAPRGSTFLSFAVFLVAGFSVASSAVGGKAENHLRWADGLELRPGSQLEHRLEHEADAGDAILEDLERRKSWKRRSRKQKGKAINNA